MLVRLEFTDDPTGRRISKPGVSSHLQVTAKGEVIATYRVAGEEDLSRTIGIVNDREGVYECRGIDSLLEWSHWNGEHPWVDGQAAWKELEATPDGDEGDRLRERFFKAVSRLRYGCVDNLDQVMEMCQWAIESEDPYVIGFHDAWNDPEKGYHKSGGYHGIEEREPDEALFFEIVRLLPRENDDA